MPAAALTRLPISARGRGSARLPGLHASATSGAPLLDTPQTLEDLFDIDLSADLLAGDGDELATERTVRSARFQALL